MLRGSIDQIPEIVSVLGPPSVDDLASMSCQDSALAGLFGAARLRDSFGDAIAQKMGFLKFNQSRNILKLLQEVIVYNPDKRASAANMVEFISNLKTY